MGGGTGGEAPCPHGGTPNCNVDALCCALEGDEEEEDEEEDGEEDMTGSSGLGVAAVVVSTGGGGGGEGSVSSASKLSRRLSWEKAVDMRL